MVDGCHIRALSPGEAEITALQTGNLLYAAAAPVSQTLVVEKGDGVGSFLSDDVKTRLSGGFLCVEFSREPACHTTVELWTSDGCKVKGMSVGGCRTCMIPVVGLSSGLYLLKVTNGDGGLFRKVVL